MRTNHLRQNSCAVLAAFIWGTAFVAQSICARYVSPFTFTASRFVIATLVMGGIVAIIEARQKKRGDERNPRDWKALLTAGTLCGTLLGTSTILQQAGLGGTSAGKAGFITALYIVVVPILGLFLHKKVTPLVWMGMVSAVFGLYFLCMTESFSISLSDTFVILCAIFFAVHILVVDHYDGRVNSIELSLVQLAAATVWALLGMLIFETPDAGTIEGLRICFWPILYMGIFPSGVAYTLQILAQRDSNPTVTALLLSLESVFAAVAGALILKDQMSIREYAGCFLMMVAVVLAQLPPISLKRKEEDLSVES